MNYYEQEKHMNSYKKSEASNIHINNILNDDDVVTVGMWILIAILLAIPFVNIIAILFMAFGTVNQNIKNFARANLIIIGIILLLYILLILLNIV